MRLRNAGTSEANLKGKELAMKNRLEPIGAAAHAGVITCLALAIACLLTLAAPAVAMASDATTATTQEELETALTSGSGTITVTGDLTLDDLVELPTGASVTLTGSGTVSVGERGGILVPEGSALTIDGEGLVLDGGGAETTHGVPAIWCRGNLTLKTGAIRNFTCGDYSGSQSADMIASVGVSAIYVESTGSQASFTMDGGSIDHNATTGTNYGGAGVMLLGRNASMTLNGGSVSDNSAQRSDDDDLVMGGGILLFNGPTLTMNGGKVSGNVAGSLDFGNDAMGGGIGAVGLGYTCNIVMNGGGVSGNKALSGSVAAHGGGIGTHTHTTFVANGGSVTNNETNGMGGGLYVDGLSGSKDGAEVASNRFYNTIVTGNTATNLGGGLWICPTGYGTIDVTNGAAIYGNTAGAGAQSAGDDVAIHPRATSGRGVTLSDRMLGGGLASWYADGGVQGNDADGSPNVAADPTAPRYDASNPGSPLSLKSDTDPHALKNVTSDEAEELSSKLATFVVSGNKAMVGGGIATNQMISFGGDENGHDSSYSLTIDKSWDDSVAESERTSVNVSLTIGGVRVDSAELGDENGWSATFSDLPAPDGYESDGTPYVLDAKGAHLDFGIAEEDGEWATKVGAWTADATSRTLSVSVTNSRLTPAQVSLTGSKQISGRGFTDGDSFTFDVEALDGAPKLSCGDSASITPTSGSSAEIDFGQATFTKAGTYTYRITERMGSLSGMSYDTTPREAIVTVSPDGAGGLEANVAYRAGNETTDGLTWTNAFSASAAGGASETPSGSGSSVSVAGSDSGSDKVELPQTGDAGLMQAALAAFLGAAVALCGAAATRRV